MHMPGFTAEVVLDVKSQEYRRHYNESFTKVDARTVVVEPMCIGRFIAFRSGVLGLRRQSRRRHVVIVGPPSRHR